MLSQEQIKATIVQRILVANKSCNSHHIEAIHNQVRALLYVLGDGAKPIRSYSVVDICSAAGIPTITNEDDTIGFPEDWLVDHGFIVNGDEISHPIFGVGW